MNLADDAIEAHERLDAIRLRTRPRLPRRDDGGIQCQACDVEIPEARRKAVPGCPFCVDCQEEADRMRA